LGWTQIAAGLNVSGTLTGDLRWMAADSPVQVTGDLLIPTGSRLTVEPGVTVQFEGPYQFVVNGTLQAVGTAVDWVVFTAANPTMDSLRWRGLRFINADRESRLVFCRVEYGWARGEWPLDSGGGIYLEGSAPTISRCDIRNNRADGDGGGIYGWFTTATMSNNVVVLNRAYRFGGGIFIDYSSPNIVNCTVAYDSASAWGGGIFLGAGSQPVIKNCILNFNTQRDSLDGERILPGTDFFPNLGKAHGAQADVTFSCINIASENVYPGAGNILADPQFRSGAPDYDFHLKYSSSCVDAGDPQMSPGNEPDVLVNRIDMGAYGGTEEATLSVPVIYVDLYELGVALNYDSIRTGVQSTKEIKVENRGHYRLHLTDFQFSSSVFFPDTAENDNGVMVPSFRLAPIEPGERVRFNINFKPDTLVTYQDTLRIVSSDTINPQPFLKLVGTGINPVAVMRDSLKFGRRAIGATHKDSLYVRNIGQSELRLRSSTMQGSGFDITIVDRVIGPGDSGKVRVTFEPTFPQFYSSYGTINTNDKVLPLTMTGTGMGPKMVMEDSALFLGYVYADPVSGDTISRTVMIGNEGADTLHISNVTVSDPAFSVPLPVGGLAVADSERVELPVYFHPTVVNRSYSALMVIFSNYPQTDTVRLSGQGMASPGRYMFGHVSGVWGWSTGSPDYIVLDSVYVPADERLKIEAGARMLFEPGAFLQADGELRALGMSGDSVYFLPRDASGADAARWGGMNLSLKDGTRLSYCVIRGSRDGLRITESSPRVEFCTISENGDTTQSGGGVYLENAGARINGCLIESNKAKQGGGVYILNSVPWLTNSVIRNNAAQAGGGLYMRFLVGALLQSNLIYGNSGGAVVVREHSAPRLVNNTIADNTGGGLSVAVRSMPVLVNNVIWHCGEPALGLEANSNALVSYCDIEGGVQGTANLDADPQFLGTGAEPYRLGDESPLIDRGNPELSHRDYFFPPSQGTEHSDIGAYGGPLGGNWLAPDVDMSVFQNPAFPQWLDIVISGLDTLQGIPTCSLQVAGGAMQALTVMQLDTLAFRGSYETTVSGTMFITVDADLPVGHRKVGRTYEIVLVHPEQGGGGYIQMVGVDGGLELPNGAVSKPLTIVAGSRPEPIKPDGELLFISPRFFVSGWSGELAKPATMTVNLAKTGWGEFAPEKLGIYQLADAGWERLDGSYQDGQVTGWVKRAGDFAVAWDEGADVRKTGIVPGTVDVVCAYPNPFNGMVSIGYELTTAGEAALRIYDLSGRLVAELANRVQLAGRHQTVWSGVYRSGDAAPSGIYWVRLETARGMRATKVVLIR
jgi:hypothetical protein